MRYLPTRGLSDVLDDMFNDRMFEMPSLNHAMKTDILEKDGNYELHVELPGYQKDEIQISLHDGELCIEAEKKEEHEEKDDKGHLIHEERFFGSCKRSFYVGETLKPEDVKASFENGILTLHLTMKKEEPVSNNMITIE